MRGWENADIQFDVSSNNCEDSNLFLRKFYEALFQDGKGGWFFQANREDKVIYIGSTNYGEMWLGYKERGKIDKIYFQTRSSEAHDLVEAALKCAKQNHSTMKQYTVAAVFHTQDILFCDMRRNGIEITSKEDADKRITSVIFPVYAFGKFDLEYVITHKVNYLKYLLCVYTNIIFHCVSVTYTEGEYNVTDNDWQQPDTDWIDVDEQFIDEKNKIMSLCSDFFDLFRIVIDAFEYRREIRLILNAAQEIFCSKKMINSITHDGAQWNMPGYTDLANTLMISALEPLSSIYGVEPDRCKECGNLKYSIRKKVRDLCNKYLPEFLAKEIYDKGYAERSSFLHEGRATTNEFYCGHCVPLINPADGRSMLNPSARVDYNLFDYVSYIFRKITSDVLNTN